MKTPESLAIFVEQGAGDMLMCLRYAQHLAMQGVKIVLEASHDLLEFMRFETQNLPITVIALDEPLPCSVEAYAWAMSLPGLCWPLVGEVKTGGFPPSGEAPKFVAFCWQGSRAHKSDRIRSCPPDTWLEISHLVRQAGLIPIALNPGEPTPSWLEDPPTPIRNFADSARVLRECAAVVSIDTSLVHLAGVLGVPTFAAVAALPDWRWGLRGQGAIRWYESVQLVRQPTIGDWNSVVADISTRLSELLHLSTSTAP